MCVRACACMCVLYVQCPGCQGMPVFLPSKPFYMEMTQDMPGTGDPLNTADDPMLMGMAFQWEDISIHYGCRDMDLILISPLAASVFLFDNKIFYLLCENFPEHSRNNIGKTHSNIYICNFGLSSAFLCANVFSPQLDVITFLLTKLLTRNVWVFSFIQQPMLRFSGHNRVSYNSNF